MELNSETRTIVRASILSVFLVLIMALGSQVFGLSRSGFEFDLTNLALTQFYFYIGPAIAYLVALLLLQFIIIKISTSESYGTSTAFNSPGEFPSIPGKFFKNPFKLLLFCVILFGVIGLYGAINHQTFTGVGVLSNQFTFTDNLIYSSLLIPAAENLGAALVIAAVIFGIIWYALKYKWGKPSVRIMMYIAVPLLTGFYGYLNHLTRYGSSGYDMISVFMFWAVGGAVTLMFGSFIPFWILHIVNNLFFSLSGQFSNGYIILFTIIMETLLGAVFVFFFILRKENPKQILVDK